MASYGSPVIIRTWSNPNTSAHKKWDVLPYKNGSVVTDARLVDELDEQKAKAYFQKLLDVAEASRLAGTDIYDSIVLQQYTSTIPS